MGDIYLSGSNAAETQYTNLIQTTSLTTTSNLLYDIICDGYESCHRSSMIRNANNLYCLASSSCSSVSLIANVNNVFGMGDDSLAGSDMYNISKNVIDLGTAMSDNRITRAQNVCVLSIRFFFAFPFLCRLYVN